MSDPSAAEMHDEVEIVDIARLQREADAIVLHAPLTPRTAGMIDAGFLAACQRRPVIVNVSRGG